MEKSVEKLIKILKSLQFAQRKMWNKSLAVGKSICHNQNVVKVFKCDALPFDRDCDFLLICFYWFIAFKKSHRFKFEMKYSLRACHFGSFCRFFHFFFALMRLNIMLKLHRSRKNEAIFEHHTQTTFIRSIRWVRAQSKMKSEYEMKQKVNKQLKFVFCSVGCRSLPSSRLFILHLFCSIVYTNFFWSAPH